MTEVKRAHHSNDGGLPANSGNRDILLVDGFPTEEELDRFVKSEIRYMKGFDMGAYRCSGRRLKFVFSGLARLPSYVRELSISHPQIEFRLLVGGPRLRYYAYKAGKPLAGGAGATELRNHETAVPAEETLYETFN
ncbi:MAG TPA: hypothetical protein VMW87_00025 [Spirochaetia bacterium]|nr:hypothetical protein [Spirochaetia bacterium]